MHTEGILLLDVEHQGQLSVTRQRPSSLLATGLRQAFIMRISSTFSISIRLNENLMRAPWWGEFFERLTGIMKRALTKKIGIALQQYRKLEDVLLDVECFMNNRPEFDRPVLTPNILLHSYPA